MNVASAGQNDACIDREDPSIREAFSENFCSHGIVFIAETGKKDSVIGKIKIDIAGGKAFPGFPLIFDDSFVLYDEDRLRTALKWLKKAYPGQIIIFTCHQREAQMMTAEQIAYRLVTM